MPFFFVQELFACYKDTFPAWFDVRKERFFVVFYAARFGVEQIPLI